MKNTDCTEWGFSKKGYWALDVLWDAIENLEGRPVKNSLTPFNVMLTEEATKLLNLASYYIAEKQGSTILGVKKENFEALKNLGYTIKEKKWKKYIICSQKELIEIAELYLKNTTTKKVPVSSEDFLSTNA